MFFLTFRNDSGKLKWPGSTLGDKLQLSLGNLKCVNPIYHTIHIIQMRVEILSMISTDAQVSHHSSKTIFNYFFAIILPSKKVPDLHQAELKEQLSPLPHWVNFIGHTNLENTGNQRNSGCMSTDPQPQNVFQPILPRLTPLRLKGQERFAQRATLTKGVIRKNVVASMLLLLLLSGGCPNNQCQNLFQNI